MTQTTRPIRVLFVCMGNICRSPTAQGVFTSLVRERGWLDRFHIDSAGTLDYHVGDPPDPRAQSAALLRGVDLSSLRARQVCEKDFQAFDYVLAMDRENLDDLRRQCPAQNHDRVKLFLEFAPDAGVDEVPDPYYGGAGGFERVLALVTAASEGLLEHIEDRHFS